MDNHTPFVEALYAAFMRGDLPAILESCAPGVVWESNADRERVAWGGQWRGHEGATGFFIALAGNLEFLAFEPRSFHPSGETVVVLGHTKARFRTGAQGVFDSDWAHVFTVKDGKLAAFREFYDTAAMERAQGG